MRLAIALLGALAGTAAASPANALDANLRAGASNPAGERVNAGPTLGLSFGAFLADRIRLVGSIERSVHSLASGDDKVLDATLGTVGLQVAIDLLPVIPFAGAGPALQHAQRRDTAAATAVPTGYVTFGLEALVFDHVRVCGQVRYLAAGVTSDSFPAYTSFLFDLGWAF